MRSTQPASGRTVLVTGGAGFIGSHTVARLAQDGLDVVAFDPLRIYSASQTRDQSEQLRYRREVLLRDARLVRGSTESRDEIRRAISDFEPRYVVHLGALALSTTAMCESDRALASIVRGTLNVLEAAAEAASVEKFVYVSSSMVYGDFTRVPMPESEPPSPKDVYGGMKFAGEILTRVFSRTAGLRIVIVRPSAVYGPTDIGSRIVQRLVECACWQQPVTLVNPETTWLDFTYVADVAGGLARAVLEPVENETFNITAGQGRTLSELYNLLRRHSPNMPVEIVEREEDFRPLRGALDIDKARRLLGYEPHYRLEAGLEEYLQFMGRLRADEESTAPPAAGSEFATGA